MVKKIINKTKVCDLCGSTFNDIVRSGKAGCARCYDTFRDEFAVMILQIQGKINHVGRKPK